MDLSFDEHGFHVVPALAPSDELAQLRAFFSAEDVDGRTLVHRLSPVQVESTETFARARTAVASMGGGAPRLEFAQWYCKPAAAPGADIPWHQDRAFWTPRRGPTVTTWIALDETNAANGCMRVSPGSHLGQRLREHSADPATTIRTCTLEPHEREAAIELRAGDALVYHERLVHRSGGNETDAPRRALVLGWTAD